MKDNLVPISCLGCLGTIAIIYFLVMAIICYNMPKTGDELFYDNENMIYIKMIRTIDSDYGYVSLGRTMIDIENKKDYFKVERNYGASLRMAISKSSDSIFVFGNFCEVISSSNFSITPVIQESVEEMIIDQSTGNTTMCQHPDYDYDLHFRLHSSDYWLYQTTWDHIWHKDGIINVYDGYDQRKANLYRSFKSNSE